MSDMTAKELKDELSKRELKCTGKKDELRQRLKSFLQNKECRKYRKRQNEKLIKGFTRTFCRENDARCTNMFAALDPFFLSKIHCVNSIS
eukprot:720060_1